MLIVHQNIGIFDIMRNILKKGKIENNIQNWIGYSYIYNRKQTVHKSSIYYSLVHEKINLLYLYFKILERQF